MAGLNTEGSRLMRISLLWFFKTFLMFGLSNNPWFNILLHTPSIVCATVDSQCSEYLEYMYNFVCSLNIPKQFFPYLKSSSFWSSSSVTGKCKKIEAKPRIRKAFPFQNQCSSDKVFQFNEMSKISTTMIWNARMAYI